MSVGAWQYTGWGDFVDEQEAFDFYGMSGGGVSGGVDPITFPTTRLRIRVEILINGEWIDLAALGYVKYADAIKIMRGRRNEQGLVSPSTCRLTLKNADRRFAPRNTTGPYYPYIGRGTKLRVFLNPGSGDSLRFTGEVPDWEPRWSTGDDRSVSIEASGPLRRIGQGTPPTRSCWYRFITSAQREHPPVAYWSCEDGASATQAASSVTGVEPLLASGGSSESPGVQFAKGTTRTQPRYTGFEIVEPATLPLASLGDGGSLSGTFTPSTRSPVEWTVQFVGRAWAFGIADITIAQWDTPGGTHTRWEVRMSISDGGFYLITFDSVGASSILIGPLDLTSMDLVEFKVSAAQNGGNVDVTFAFTRAKSDGTSGSSSSTSTSVAGTLVHPTTFVANPNRTDVPIESGGGAANQDADIVVGHVQIYDDATVDALTDTSTGLDGIIMSAWSGFVGERPTDRFARMCLDEGLAYVISELVAETEPMGLQQADTFEGGLRSCEAASEGLLDETVAGELRLASRTARWVPDVPLVLDYAHATYGNQVNGMKPADNDFALTNDWTITREGGSIGHAEQTTGPANVSESADDPIEGVGRRPKTATLILAEDPQAEQHASWRVRAGTVDELRYPLIAFRLDSHPELIVAWLASDVNARLGVLNPPQDVGPGAIAQYVEGYAEQFDQFTWTAGVNASPVAAGEAFRWSDPSGAARYDCAGSTLAEDLDTTETGVDLAITDNCVWAHDNGDYVITIGGEDMTVTAVSAAVGTFPATRTQTLTVTRSVNGAILTHATGQSVRLKSPARYAL